jgi:hypothetical protein
VLHGLDEPVGTLIALMGAHDEKGMDDTGHITKDREHEVQERLHGLATQQNGDRRQNDGEKVQHDPSKTRPDRATNHNLNCSSARGIIHANA